MKLTSPRNGDLFLTQTRPRYQLFGITPLIKRYNRKMKKAKNKPWYY